MIEITYDEANYSVTVKGHAGYCAPGHDIVCAGVSALLYAVKYRAEEAHRAQTDLTKKGFGFVRCYPVSERDEALCREMLETAMTGLRAIASSWPEYVRVREVPTAHTARGEG